MRTHQKINFMLVFMAIQLLMNANCIKNCEQTELKISSRDIDSFKQKNITFNDLPFLYNQKQIHQVAGQNIEQSQTNSTDNSQQNQNSGNKQQYYILQLEQQNDEYVQVNQTSFEDKKIVGIVKLEQKLIAVFCSGQIRIIDLNNNTLEQEIIESNVKDAEGILEFSFKNDQYLAIYGRSVSIYQLQNHEKLVHILETKSDSENAIKNVLHLNGMIYYFTSKQLGIINLIDKATEMKDSVQDYSHAFLFQLYNDTILILPYCQDNSTSTFVLYQANSTSSSPATQNLLTPIERIKTAISYYQGEILIKNNKNEVSQISFDNNNKQTNKNQELAIGIDSTFFSTSHIKLLSQNEFKYSMNICSHCSDNEFLQVPDDSLPYCKKDNGIEQEVSFTTFAVVLVGVLLLFCAIKICQNKETNSGSNKSGKKAMQVSTKDDETFHRVGEDEYDIDNLQHNNVTALHDRKQGRANLDQSAIAMDISMSNKLQMASQNKSFAQPKLRGSAVQLEDLEESSRGNIQTINEVDE